MKRIRFGMFWECYGYQNIELPDDIDANDSEAICDYLRENWNGISIPAGSYVTDSDDFDPESIEVYEEEEK